MGNWKSIAGYLLVLNVVVTILLWSMQLYRDYVFRGQLLMDGRQFLAVLSVVIYPVWDGRREIRDTVKGIVADLKNFSRRGTRL